jgi:hypothetical protein
MLSVLDVAPVNMVPPSTAFRSYLLCAAAGCLASTAIFSLFLRGAAFVAIV